MKVSLLSRPLQQLQKAENSVANIFPLKNASRERSTQISFGFDWLRTLGASLCLLIVGFVAAC